MLKILKILRKTAIAKSEIIQNTKKGGFVVLNADDNFFNLHKRIAIKIISDLFLE